MPLRSVGHIRVLATTALLGGAAFAQVPHREADEGKGNATTASASNQAHGDETVLDGSKDPSTISLTEASMSFYRSVLAEERRQRGGGLALLSAALKFDDVKSAAYLNYMYMAVDDGQYQLVERSQLICARRKELTMPAQFADALEKLHLSILSNWEYTVKRSTGVLGDEGKRVADTYILRTRNAMKLPVTDYGKYVAMSGKSVGAMLADLCDPQPQGATSAR